MLLQSSPLLSSVSRMEFKDVKCFTTAWSLGRFALAQGEKGRCATSAFHNAGLDGMYEIVLDRSADVSVWEALGREDVQTRLEA